MGNLSLIKYRVPLIYLALTAVTFIAFEHVRYNDFINFDDTLYVTENPNVQKGLTPASIAWAFTDILFASNPWHGHPNEKTFLAECFGC